METSEPVLPDSQPRRGADEIAPQAGWWRGKESSLLEEVLRRINAARLRESSSERENELIRVLHLIHELGDRRREAVTHQASLNSQARLVMALETMPHQAIHDDLEALFERPGQRLAVYGSLRPGESNAHQMTGIKGTWRDGTVPGIVYQPTQYLEFIWEPQAPKVPVKVMFAPNLPDHFERLDEFEGVDYVRTWVPVTIDGVIHVCNIYEGKRRLKT